MLASKAQRGFRWALFGVLAIWLAAYANSLRNEFQFDDDHVVQRNLYIRDVRNIPRFFVDATTFSTYPPNANYRPVVSTTLAVDYALGGGLQPVAFHITQLLLFLIVGTLFFFVVCSLFDTFGSAEWHRWAALFAAGLFCLHTGNTQPANYISARSELLCAMGLLGAFLIYLRAPRLRRFQLYLVPMVLGAMAKPPAIIFSALLLIYRLLFEAELSPQLLRTRDGWRRIGSTLLSTLPALIASVATFWFVEHMNPPGQSYGGAGRAQYLWTQSTIWLRYLRLFFLPTGLSGDSDLQLLPTWANGWVLVGALVLIGSLILAVLASSRREGRPVALGIFWFWLGIAPTSSIIPIGEVTNDHRMFLGWLGLTLAVTTLLFEAGVRLLARVERREAWQRAFVTAAIALLCAHAVGTHLRNRVWRTKDSLWEDVTRQSPLNGRGWMNYGYTKMLKGEYVEAKRLFDLATPLVPDYPYLAINQGVVHAALGLAPQAEAYFQRALVLGPNLGAAAFTYGRFLVAQGRAPEGALQLARAEAIDWGDPNPRELLMQLDAARGARDAVVARAKRVLAMGPDAVAQAYLEGRPPFSPKRPDASGWFETGHEYTQRQQHALAAQAYRASLRIDATQADAWNNLGWSLYSLGYADDAVTAFERAVALRPDHTHARNNLALAQERVRTERARSHATVRP